MTRQHPRRTTTAAAAIGSAAALTLSMAVSASAYTPSPDTVLTPDNLETCNKFPCVLYPKSTQLPSGRIVLAFEDSRGAVDGQDIPIYTSDDNGDTWQPLAEVAPPAELSSDPDVDKYVSNWTNPYLFVMPETVGDLAEGTLLLSTVVSGEDEWFNERKAADPSWLPDGDGDRRDLAISLYSSTDEGATWEFEDIIATGGWQGGSAGRPWIHSDANAYDQIDPVWEPHLDVHDGKLVAWYSDENDYLGYDPDTYVPILDPDNDTAPDSGGQILVHRTWDGTAGSEWSEPVVDVAGLTETRAGDGVEVIGGGRPGMITHAATTDGKWIQTFEYFGGGWNTRMKICDDLLKCDPSDLGKTAPGVAGGSPVLLGLPDGRIVYNDADRGEIMVNESGLSTEEAPAPYGGGGWKSYLTTVDAGYSRNLQYVEETGQLLVIQASWTAPGTASPITFAHVDIGYSAGPYFSIVNRKTGQVISTEADKTQDAIFTGDQPDIVTWDDNPANDTQRWHVVPNGDGTVSFLNKAGGRALGVWTGNVTQGQNQAQWVHNGGTDQKWNLIPTDDGYFRIQSAQDTDLYLSGWNAYSRTDVWTLLEGDDVHAEEWRFEQAITGFEDPIDPATLNTVKAGSAVPLKFNAWAVDESGPVKITDVSQVSVTGVEYPSCSEREGGSAVPMTGAGKSTLKFSDGAFQLNWTTPKAGAGTCFGVTATTADGTSVSADVELR
ncbi:PxKF domain-containing protein [Demequina pelophila]|uniref:PxKF domain-containing protein n=1 Tax=Demequina pelophila TaxID=1638984 RepID=UPI0009E4A595|nr:PxKF domain-containing protein [Demequina pelophila]